MRKSAAFSRSMATTNGRSMALQSIHTFSYHQEEGKSKVALMKNRNLKIQLKITLSQKIVKRGFPRISELLVFTITLLVRVDPDKSKRNRKARTFMITATIIS